MKKSISMVIILVLILSLIAPIGVVAEDTSAYEHLEYLYEKIDNSSYMRIIRDNESITSDRLIRWKNHLKGKGRVGSFINEVYNEIQKNNKLTEFLSSKYYINRDNINSLREIVYNWDSDYEDDVRKIINGFMSESEEIPYVWYTAVGDLREDILSEFRTEINTIESKLANPSFYGMVDLSTGFAKALMNNLIVKEKNAVPELEFSIDKEGLFDDIEDLDSQYIIDDEYKLTKKFTLGELTQTADGIVDVAQRYYEIVRDDLKELDDGKVNVDKLIAVILKSIVPEGNYISYKEPVPSVPGAPSEPSEPKLPEVTVPEDENLPATITIGEDQISVKIKEGTAYVSLDSRAAVKAVEKLRDEAGKDREAVLNIDLSSVERDNVSVEFSYDLIKAAADNNVSLNMVFDDMEVMIPADVLGAIDIAKGDKVVFRTENVTQLVNEAVGEDQDVKMGIDLYLEVVRNGSTTRVDQFNAPVVVKIEVKGLWNRDKLAVYYLNENNNTLEFVTGKIVDNQIIIRLSHFSKYLVIESNKTFSDITNHWAKLFIESMAAKNVVGGYSDGTFRPNNNITRAEFSKMILEGLEVELVKYNGEFTDVKASNWYADYLATMKKLGLAEGYNDGTFKPDQYITRAEIAVILSNVIDVEVDKDEINTLLANYTDKDQIPDWAIEAIAKVVKSKVMVGDNNRFMPSNNTTRAESVTTIYRIYNR